MFNINRKFKYTFQAMLQRKLSYFQIALFEKKFGTT